MNSIIWNKVNTPLYYITSSLNDTEANGRPVKTSISCEDEDLECFQIR